MFDSFSCCRPRGGEVLGRAPVCCTTSLGRWSCCRVVWRSWGGQLTIVGVLTCRKKFLLLRAVPSLCRPAPSPTCLKSGQPRHSLVITPITTSTSRGKHSVQFCIWNRFLVDDDGSSVSWVVIHLGVIMVSWFSSILSLLFSFSFFLLTICNSNTVSALRFWVYWCN